MTKRLFVLHPSNEWYGADQMLAAWLRSFTDVGWQVLVFVPKDTEYSGRLAQELSIWGVQVSEEDLPILRRRHLTARGLLRLGVRSVLSYFKIFLAARRADLVLLSTTAVLSAAPPVYLSRTPVVTHVQEYLGADRQGRILSYLTLKISTLVVACSNSVAMGISNKSQPHMVVVHNGIADVEPRSHAGKPGHPPTILLIGRISAWKGQDVGIRMMREPALREHPRKPLLLIVGTEPPGEEGQYLPRLQKLACELQIDERIVFMGQLDDVTQAIAEASVVLNLSQRPDPFPLTALEAMRAGAPIVSSSQGGLPEMLGTSALLVTPPDDVSALAARVVQILDDPILARDLGRAARLRWEQNFSLDAHAQKLKGLIATF
jgi:glycosyltransferase involved in cell wall biosynthesis